MKYAVKGIRHTGIVVEDLGAALAFWTDMGLSVAFITEEDSKFIDKLMRIKCSKLTTVKMQADDGTKIELLHFRSHSSPKDMTKPPFAKGIRHLALTVDSVPNGVLSPDGKVKVAYVNAHDGVILELVEELC